MLCMSFFQITFQMNLIISEIIYIIRNKTKQTYYRSYVKCCACAHTIMWLILQVHVYIDFIFKLQVLIPILIYKEFYTKLVREHTAYKLKSVILFVDWHAVNDSQANELVSLLAFIRNMHIYMLYKAYFWANATVHHKHRIAVPKLSGSLKHCQTSRAVIRNRNYLSTNSNCNKDEVNSNI